METPVDNSIFPDHNVPTKVKQSKEWLLKYATAFDNEFRLSSNEGNGLLRAESKAFTELRKLAKGKQSENTYKEMLTIQKNNGKTNDSYRNISWKILRVAPKIKEALYGKLLNRQYDITPKPIDRESVGKEKEKRFAYLENILNKDRSQELEQKYNIKIKGPGNPNEEVPQTPDEVEPHMKVNYKDEYSMEAKDYVSSVLLANDFDHVKEEGIDDLIDTDYIAARVFVDRYGRIKIRKGIIENMVTNKCVHTNFSDKIRVGEYYQCTISDLRERVGYNWGFTDETYREIANKIAGNQGDGSDKYSSSYCSDYFTNHETMPYDKERVLILDFEFFSVDKETSLVKPDEHGNKGIFPQPYNWKPLRDTPEYPDGVSDEEYSKIHDGKREVIRNEYKNVYQMCWIVGTTHAFDYGLKTNMGKVASRLTEAEMGWIIHTSNFDSTIAKIESALDAIQINWLQYQSHLASSRSPGIAFEKHALAKASKGKGGGAGGDQLFNPKEMVKQYVESGSFIYDGYDYNGNPLTTKPFQELQNGLSPAAKDHLQLLFQKIELIKYMLGLNPVTEGSSPDPETSRYLANAMNFATENTLTRLYKTMDRFVKDVSKRVADLAPDVMENPHKGIGDLVGLESKKFWNLSRDAGLTELGIELVIGVDRVLKDKISQSVDVAVKLGTLTPDDQIIIELEENPYRMQKMFRKKIKEREQLIHEREMSKIKSQEEVNINSTNASIEAEIKKKQAEYEAKLQYDTQLLGLKETFEDKAFKRQYLLSKLTGGQKLEEIETKAAWELIQIQEEGNIKDEIAEDQNESREKIAAMSKNDESDTKSDSSGK